MTDISLRFEGAADPSSIRPEGVRGKWWPIECRGAGQSQEHAVIGVAFLAEKPIQHLYHRVVDDNAMQLLAPSYSVDFMSNLRWMVAQVRVSLEAQQQESPLPADIVYGRRRSGHFDSPQHALDVLWEHQVNFMRGQLKPTNAGGVLETLTNDDLTNRVVALLRDHHVEGAGRGPDSSLVLWTPEHIAAVASGITEQPAEAERNAFEAALHIASHRKPGQRGTLFWFMPTDAEKQRAEVFAGLIARLQQQDIQTRIVHTPEETAGLLEKLARGG